MMRTLLICITVLFTSNHLLATELNSEALATVKEIEEELIPALIKLRVEELPKNIQDPKELGTLQVQFYTMQGMMTRTLRAIESTNGFTIEISTKEFRNHIKSLSAVQFYLSHLKTMSVTGKMIKDEDLRSKLFNSANKIDMSLMNLMWALSDSKINDAI